MIPVALPSVESVLLLLGSFAALVVALLWLLRLLFFTRARARFADRPKRSAALMLALVLASGFYVSFQYHVWKIDREFERRDAARHVTLAEARTLGGVAMPAGARLVLEKEGDLETYAEAAFDTPIIAFGLLADRIQRVLRTDYDDKTYAELGRYPLSVHVWGPGAQVIEDWRCDTTRPVRFDAEDKGRRIAFAACELAEGNRVAGEDAVLPAGAEVLRKDGNVYTDGHREPVSWMIRVQSPVGVRLGGLALGRPVIYLDEDRRLHSVEDAVLACPMELGELRYAAGTQVRSAGYALHKRYPAQAWVFSPVGEAGAKRAGQSDVPDGQSVVQMPDGEVLAVLSHAQAGVHRFDRIVVSDEPPDDPPVRCP